MLALCNMRTLYLRNVPDEVVERLELLARRAKVSVNTFVLWELEAATRRAANAEVLAALPDLGIAAGDLAGETLGRRE
jgi:hypothetical protein